MEATGPTGLRNRDQGYRERLRLQPPTRRAPTIGNAGRADRPAAGFDIPSFPLQDDIVHISILSAKGKQFISDFVSWLISGIQAGAPDGKTTVSRRQNGLRLITLARTNALGKVRSVRNANRPRTITESPMSPPQDLVSELESWIGRLSAEARTGKRPRDMIAAETDLLQRAAAEIRALREKLGERRATRSIPAEDLNASNDE